MVGEAYVSQDIANRLREKGFNEEPIEEFMPTQQRAMRWLREAKGIFIEITKTEDGCNYEIGIWHKNEYLGSAFAELEFETYELAVGFGLLFVLTKMDI